MYLDELAARIRAHVPPGRLPGDGAADLLRIYAVLLRAKGADVTLSDIHDAWSAWMSTRDNEHASLIAFENLPEHIQEEDRVFAVAVRRAAEESDQGGSRPVFTEVLFPAGPPYGVADAGQVLELYKVMVGSSEGLVSRRQGVNTFFLTMNGALLTAAGIIAQRSEWDSLSGVGIAVLAVAGAILCGAWRSLLISFGQLNRGKFKIINAIERYLTVAVYSAEWEALGRGEDPKVYRSFTAKEIWVPNALLVLYLLTALTAVLFSLGVFTLSGGSPSSPTV